MSLLDDLGTVADLGSGVRAAWVHLTDGRVQVWEEHDHAEGGEVRRSVGAVPIGDEQDGKHWRITAGEVGSFEGLTLEPSVLCSGCGHHGWIRDGAWVSA